jgi:hypothetical protein
MRVGVALFAGHANGGPPAAAHVHNAGLRGRHLGHAAKADDQLKVGRAGKRVSRNAGLPLSGIACAMISEDFAPF